MRKDWSRRSKRNASGPRNAAIGFVLLCVSLSGLIFGAGCAEPEPEGASSVEQATRDAIDSLTSEDGDRSVAQKIRDASVAAEVQIALMDDGDLRAFRLEPTVVNGRVLLQGEVETVAQRERAESLASGVESVREVVNRITSFEGPLIAEVRDEEVLEDSPESRVDDAEADEASDDEAPSASGEPASGASDAAVAYHTVEYGDNLWDIARAYEVSVEQITRLNDLGSSSIKPGQRLQVK